MADAVKVLSYADIRKAGACADALAEVPQWYPEGFPLSEEAVTRLVTHDYWWTLWLVENLAPLAARAEYERVRAPAWAEYQRATAAASVAALVAWGRGDYDTPEDGR